MRLTGRIYGNPADYWEIDMSTITIKEFWNKVASDDTQPFGTRVLPDYEIKSSHSFCDSGYQSRKEWQQRAKGIKGFLGFQDDGSAKFDMGRMYGIHTYQLVSYSE